ncbi:MAG: signal recognition particle receptor subunit alpha, partial [Deltaproteobacteria bacterium]|nr:signal recognition particle receptor subunit alpha [Deltaproteobacteria bacterium]
MGFFSSLRKIISSSAPQEARPKDASAPLPLDAARPEDLTLALRAAEPRLSAWLEVVLAGVSAPGDLLWQRLSFLLAALETPDEEREAFIRAFQTWLQSMEYTRLEDFRSELQYRLALALDLEDEEDERSRLLFKISQGLTKTRERIARGLDGLFSAGRGLDAAFWEELEEVLITADVGVETARTLTERLRLRAAREGLTDSGLLREALGEEICAVFKPARRITALNPPEIILLVGVNGVGKTTTIAKLCHR